MYICVLVGYGINPMRSRCELRFTNHRVGRRHRRHHHFRYSC